MSQGRLEMVKQEMARVSIDILGITELKWIRMGKFNLKPQKKWSIHHSQKESQNGVLGCNLKNDKMITVRFQGKPFNITVIQVYAPTSNAEESEVQWFYEDLQDLLEPAPKTDVLFFKGTGMQKQEVKRYLE